MHQIGREIRKRRIKLGLTQNELAEILHVTQQAVCEWESCKKFPQADRLEEIAAALKCSVLNLLKDNHELCCSLIVDYRKLLAKSIRNVFGLTDEEKKKFVRNAEAKLTLTKLEYDLYTAWKADDPDAPVSNFWGLIDADAYNRETSAENASYFAELRYIFRMFGQQAAIEFASNKVLKDTEALELSRCFPRNIRSGMPFEFVAAFFLILGMASRYSFKTPDGDLYDICKIYPSLLEYIYLNQHITNPMLSWICSAR